MNTFLLDRDVNTAYCSLMASTKSFCARCGIASASHETCAVACRNYIDPTSKAGVAIRRADAATKVTSQVLDHVLLAGTVEHLQERIKQATQATQACLLAAREGAPRTASRYAERALKALGGLGAS